MPRASGSRAGWPWMGLRLVQGLAVLAILAGAGAVQMRTGPSDADLDAFLRQTTDRWCAAHGKRDDLQAVVVDVRFRPEPPLFAAGEGTVVAPVAIDLPGAQRILDVASTPAHLRKLTTPAVTALAWEYGGRVHRPLRFRGVTLVERPARKAVTLPATPTFHELPADVRPEAMARASEMEEHGLHKCAAFAAWAVKSAGPAPHTAQIESLVKAVSNRAVDEQGGEDLCADLRAGRFTAHRAQVAVVMAAREVGVPAFGFSSADGRRIHLVGTYLDGTGWILTDVENPGSGWFAGGAPLLTMAPLLGGFSASPHDLWTPEGGAYADNQWQGVSAFSTTQWKARAAPGAAPTDTTEARAVRLADVCP